MTKKIKWQEYADVAYAEFEKLKGILNVIERQYPQGTLSAHGEHAETN